MKRKKSKAVMSAVLIVAGIADTALAEQENGYDREFETHLKVASIEYIGMPAPSTAEEKADIYTKAQLKVTYRNGKERRYDLAYHELMGTTDFIDGRKVGGLIDYYGEPLTDAGGQLASDAPDGNSLMKIPGMQAVDHRTNSALALVTQYEYKELPPVGETGSFWSKLPATMSLAKLDQNKRNGSLAVVDYRTIDFASVDGLWISCASSLSPWNTHLGSEEYEPDAKVRESLPAAAGSDDDTDIASFSRYYFGDAAAANPYHYGIVPEVSVRANGSTAVVKHHALGRIARELAEVMPDQRTVYMGDDGKNTGLFMFIADRPRDLSSGKLYAGKWQQTDTANGGSARLTWILLGSSNDQEIKDMIDGDKIKFSDIFNFSNDDPNDPSYRFVDTYMGKEWLRVKPGMEKAAAFLETRRYAAYLGATTEFSKMEGISHDPKRGRHHNGKAFVVISRLEKGMADTEGDIRLERNDGGAIYELELTGHQLDSVGNRIPSRFVAKSMNSVPELLGGWLGGAKDDEGNRCEQDKVCGGDNIKFSPAIRTLFIGEDTSRRNNNYVWAFNVETRQLARILSVPMNAEATGLQVVDDANGFSYIMSNFQHPGEGGTLSNYLGADRQEVLGLLNSKWDNLQRAAIGYIGTEDGALPAMK
ncbi:MAG: PhoX family protein [Gammaproteobacteria bacterium]